MLQIVAGLKLDFRRDLWKKNLPLTTKQNYTDVKIIKATCYDSAVKGHKRNLTEN